MQTSAHRPPRNYICVKCDRNGHWAHNCPLQVQGRNAYVCNKCHGNHFVDVCPYRANVSSNYECRLYHSVARCHL